MNPVGAGFVLRLGRPGRRGSPIRRLAYDIVFEDPCKARSSFEGRREEMHDVLRDRLLRKIESLPEDQIYQVLDYIEFLEAKYAGELAREASGLQRFAERLEDRMRRKAVSPNTLREAFQLIAAADRVLSSVSSAGRDLLDGLNGALEGPSESKPAPATSAPRSGKEAPGASSESRGEDHDQGDRVRG